MGLSMRLRLPGWTLWPLLAAHLALNHEARINFWLHGPRVPDTQQQRPKEPLVS